MSTEPLPTAASVLAPAAWYPHVERGIVKSPPPAWAATTAPLGPLRRGAMPDLSRWHPGDIIVFGLPRQAPDNTLAPPAVWTWLHAGIFDGEAGVYEAFHGRLTAQRTPLASHLVHLGVAVRRVARAELGLELLETARHLAGLPPHKWPGMKSLYPAHRPYWERHLGFRAAAFVHCAVQQAAGQALGSAEMPLLPAAFFSHRALRIVPAAWIAEGESADEDAKTAYLAANQAGDKVDRLHPPPLVYQSHPHLTRLLGESLKALTTWPNPNPGTV